MTGGYAGAQSVNEIIAEACESWNLPFGVGSQRAMLVDTEQAKTFSIVRKKAPKSFIAANIGAVQLLKDVSQSDIKSCIDAIEADALIIHLNPLQELMQKDGDRNFKGILKAIEQARSFVSIPIIVKETGAGIDFQSAKKLNDCGVSVIDIAGAGGTSWAKVETIRSKSERFAEEFDEWGIPLANCLETYKGRDRSAFSLIASGGIKSPFDSLKSLALGADFTATAQPIIREIIQNGAVGLHQLLLDWEDAQKKIQLLLGVQSLKNISAEHIYKANKKLFNSSQD
ncbi:type 2 isopentenyl-diphosphate Delta-isomerase [bacterium]|nr:MAG: type 2 isopentenyl-diphosphate Delta-isomerase [bacterium]